MYGSNGRFEVSFDEVHVQLRKFLQKKQKDLQLINC